MTFVAIDAFRVKHHSNAPLNELLCRTHDSATQTKGQGHSSRVLPFIFGVCSISPETFE